MPEAVIFHHQGKTHTVFFTQPHAMLPVKLKTGDIKLIPWGRRETENNEFPLGGWARLNNIKNGKNSSWNLYLPKPVQIPVDKFMERNFEGKATWYEITKGKCILGLLAQSDNECRVYIVTVDPDDLMTAHYRWPNIVTSMIKVI